VLAQAGLFLRRTYAAPFAGTLTRVVPDRGAIVLTPAATEVALWAHVAGTVERVLPGRGVELSVDGLACQALAGGGPETHGPLRVRTGPDEALTAERCDETCRGAIVVGGYLAPGARPAAAQHGVAALVVATVPGDVLGELATGGEGPAIVVTHGLGRRAMPPEAHAVLVSLEGQTASVVLDGAWLPGAVAQPLLLVSGGDRGSFTQPAGAVVAGPRRGTMLASIDTAPQPVACFGPLRGPAARVRLREGGEQRLPAWAIERWTTPGINA
jgi:hypothetical protein